MPPTDLLQLLALGSKSGILSLNRKDDNRNLFINTGQIVGVNSSRSKDRLGALLLRMNLISRKQLADLRDEQSQKNTQMGRLLIKKKWISEKTLKRVLSMQVHEITFELMTWQDGTFVFEERQLTEAEQLVEPFPISSLLLEGARRIDEWSRIRKVIPHDSVVLRRLHDDDITISGWTPIQVNVWFKLANPSSIKELIKTINESEFNILSALRGFIEHDFVCIDEELERERGEVREKCRIHLEHAHALEAQQGYYEAIDELDNMLKIQPDDQEAIEMKFRLKKSALKEARKIIPSDKVIPKIRQSFTSLAPDKFKLSSYEGFVFSRIDGFTNVKSLRYLTNLDPNDLHIILHKLSRMGLIYMEKPEGTPLRTQIKP